MRKRRQLRASDYGRCAFCGRLTEKESLKPGPEGPLVGPDCMPRAVAAWNNSVQSVRDAVRANEDEMDMS